MHECLILYRVYGTLKHYGFEYETYANEKTMADHRKAAFRTLQRILAGRELREFLAWCQNVRQKDVKDIDFFQFFD